MAGISINIRVFFKEHQKTNVTHTDNVTVDFEREIRFCVSSSAYVCLGHSFPQDLSTSAAEAWDS